jgi:hypothetical protein
MTTTLNASTSSGFVMTPDNSGNILLQYNGVAAPAFRAYCSSSITVADGTTKKVPFQTEVFDTANCFDNATNYRFTPTVAGYYQINASVTGSSGIVGTSWFQTLIYKNGSADTYGTVGIWTSSNWPNSSASNVIYLNGSTDYVEVYCQSNYTSGVGLNTGGFCNFSGCLLRGA